MAAGAAAAIGVGTLIQAHGKRKASKAQAAAEKKNQAFLRLQADATEKTARREAELFERQGEELIGQQTSLFAKAGVDMSGSALLKISETQKRLKSEVRAILSSGRRSSEFAALKSDAAGSRAPTGEGGLRVAHGSPGPWWSGPGRATGCS